MAKHYVYQFYAELKEYEPKIWRRFVINGEKSMAELAYTTMIIFEMQASHLFTLKEDIKSQIVSELNNDFTDSVINLFIEKNSGQINFDTIRYELPFDENITLPNECIVYANGIRINSAMAYSNTVLTLEYDFGDGWEVELLLESIEEQEISLSKLPKVLEGTGFGIVEDVGGVSGLKKLRDILLKGEGDDYDSYTMWLDSDSLDLDYFDIDDANFRIKKLLRVYRNSYELNSYPSEESYKILVRRYLKKGVRGY